MSEIPLYRFSMQTGRREPKRCENRVQKGSKGGPYKY